MTKDINRPGERQRAGKKGGERMAKGYVLVPVIIKSSYNVSNAECQQYGILSTDNRYMVGFAHSGQGNIPIYSFRVGSVVYYLVFSSSSYRFSIFYQSNVGVTTGNANGYVIDNSAIYYQVAYQYGNNLTGLVPATLSAYDPYSTLDEALADILSETYSTISYVTGSVAVAGPKLVADGSQVKAYVTPPRGVTVTDSDISITKSGVSVQFTYSNGVLTFTA